MKTISIRFSNGPGLTAEVRGSFASLPGPGKLEWSGRGNLEAALTSPYAAPLPDFHFAEAFLPAMQALAQHHEWAVEEVRTVGEWDVFTE